MKYHNIPSNKSLLLILLILVLTLSLLNCTLSTSDGHETYQEGSSNSEPLYWSPPPLTDPITIEIASDSGSVIRMEPDQDYILQFPDEPVRGNIIISGGHNVVIIGGEIAIPWRGEDPSIRHRTGLTIYDPTGVVHIEGLLIHGEDVSEGFQITAPEAIVQIQNVAVMGIHARDQVEFSDNHPDLIQTLGNVGELRVDRFTGSTDYQGFFFKADDNGSHNSVNLRHVNLIGLPTARYLFWIHAAQWIDSEWIINDWEGSVTLHDVWIDVPEEREGGLGDAIWPPIDFDYPMAAQLFRDEHGRLCATWSSEMHVVVNGYLCEGLPEGGNFVSVEDIGIGYQSPGYQGNN